MNRKFSQRCSLRDEPQTFRPGFQALSSQQVRSEREPAHLQHEQRQKPGSGRAAGGQGPAPGLQQPPVGGQGAAGWGGSDIPALCAGPAAAPQGPGRWHRRPRWGWACPGPAARAGPGELREGGQGGVGALRAAAACPSATAPPRLRCTLRGMCRQEEGFKTQQQKLWGSLPPFLVF